MFLIVYTARINPKIISRSCQEKNLDILQQECNKLLQRICHSDPEFWFGCHPGAPDTNNHCPDSQNDLASIPDGLIFHGLIQTCIIVLFAKNTFIELNLN